MDWKMETAHKWPASRILHLFGGCRAINNLGPVVELYPAPLEGKKLRLQLPNYPSIYSILEKSGLSILGVDFFSNAWELKGLIPPNWRTYHRRKPSSWSGFNAKNVWSNIGTAAFNRKDGTLWDLASRISYQILVCNLRLREVSESYNKQLCKCIERNSFKLGDMFMDGYTIPVYMSLHTFLIDACILRDSLAEFAAQYIFTSQCSKLPKITNMGSLKKYFLKKVDTSTDPLIKQLNIDTDEGGWIHKLGSYRDLVTHSAPLILARQKLFVLCSSIDIGGDKKLPAIFCPIPEKPSEIRASRAKGDHFNNFSDQFSPFIGNGSLKQDGLQYIHGVLENILILSQVFATFTPYKPEIMHFKGEEILNFEEIKQD